MAKSKDPAFLFYPSDFILGTYTMSDEQVGKYIRLLCLQFSKGGKLTYDDILKVLDKDENELGRKDREILEKFKIDEEGLYYNQRLLDEIKDREERSLINKQNGSKGGNPNFTKGKSNVYYQTDKQLDNQKDNQTVMLSDNQIDKPIDNQKINIALKDENKDINEVKDLDLIVVDNLKPKSKNKLEVVTMYFEDIELNKTFIDFMNMRKSLKNGAMTERAITMMVNKLKKYDVNKAIEMLEQSILNNWKDVFEVKQSFKQQEKKSSKDDWEELRNAVK